MDMNGRSPKILPLEALAPYYFLSRVSSLVDGSLCHSKQLFAPGNIALHETFSRVSKCAGTALLWLASAPSHNIFRKLPGSSYGSNLSSCKPSAKPNYIISDANDIPGFLCNFRLKGVGIPDLISKFSQFSIAQLWGEVKKLQTFPVLSLAGVLVPPLENVYGNVLALPLENGDILMQRCIDERPCEVESRGFRDFSYGNVDYSRRAVEAKTGIEFPTILDNIFGETSSSLISEVLVGTGSRTMKIIKIKSLKLYAFGFYVHPYDVCKKLGPKYAAIPASEVDKQNNFYADLLSNITLVPQRLPPTVGEDINMTVRLVVSCNGIKISNVRDAFEKSLRARLLKTNPEADHDCLSSFGSLFQHDIPILVGTTIDFRRTADGHLVTEIEGNQIGAVRSKDLCRAFFDMYIGDVPVSEQTKTEIGKNVASMMRSC